MTELNQPQPNRTPNSHGPETHGYEDDRPPISGRKAILVLTVVLVVAAVVAVAELIPRLRAEKTLKTRTGELAVANVTVEEPKAGAPSQEIVLPGNMFAYVDSPIYARTDGYLEKWYFDIGAQVRKGQLLATIASPEVDQQLAQAKADLATAEANAGYAKQQASRYTDLLASNAVAKQDTENFVTQAASTNMQVKSAAGQRPADRAADRLRKRLRALRRHRHRARRRYRHADQRRRGNIGRTRDVPHG